MFKTNQTNPILLALATEAGAEAQPARGANQVVINGRWIGFYGGFGGWQIEPVRGGVRVVVTRDQALAFAKDGTLPGEAKAAPMMMKDLGGWHRGEADVVVIRRSVKEAAAAIAPEEVVKEMPLQALAVTGFDKTAIVCAALAAGKSSEEVIAIIAALS